MAKMIAMMVQMKCHVAPLDPKSKSIVRRCAENRSVCIPLDKYCDIMVDCPFGSDDLDMMIFEKDRFERIYCKST